MAMGKLGEGTNRGGRGVEMEAEEGVDGMTGCPRRRSGCRSAHGARWREGRDQDRGAAMDCAGGDVVMQVVGLAAWGGCRRSPERGLGAATVNGKE